MSRLRCRLSPVTYVLNSDTLTSTVTRTPPACENSPGGGVAAIPSISPRVPGVLDGWIGAALEQRGIDYAFTSTVPFASHHQMIGIRRVAGGPTVFAESQEVDSHYLAILRAKVVAGTLPGAADLDGVVVNLTLSKQLFSGAGAVGETLAGGSMTYRIMAVVADTPAAGTAATQPDRKSVV